MFYLISYIKIIEKRQTQGKNANFFTYTTNISKYPLNIFLLTLLQQNVFSKMAKSISDVSTE